MALSYEDDLQERIARMCDDLGRAEAIIEALTSTATSEREKRIYRESARDWLTRRAERRVRLRQQFNLPLDA